MGYTSVRADRDAATALQLIGALTRENNQDIMWRLARDYANEKGWRVPDFTLASPPPYRAEEFVILSVAGEIYRLLTRIARDEGMTRGEAIEALARSEIRRMHDRLTQEIGRLSSHRFK